MKTAVVLGAKPPDWSRRRVVCGLCPLPPKRSQTAPSSYSQVGAILANITDNTADLFGHFEQAMVAALADLNVIDTTHVMSEWATRAKASI